MAADVCPEHHQRVAEDGERHVSVTAIAPSHLSDEPRDVAHVQGLPNERAANRMASASNTGSARTSALVNGEIPELVDDQQFFRSRRSAR